MPEAHTVMDFEERARERTLLKMGIDPWTFKSLKDAKEQEPTDSQKKDK